MATPARAVEIELGPQVREFLNLQANRIRAFSKDLIHNASLIGESLSEARKRLNYGQWQAWLEHEFSWSQRYALDLIYVHEWVASGELKSSSVLSIDLSAMCLLSRPSTPPIAREQAIRMLEQGERVTTRHAGALVEAAKKVVPMRKLAVRKPAKPKRRSSEEVAAENRRKELDEASLRIASCVESLAKLRVPAEDVGTYLMEGGGLRKTLRNDIAQWLSPAVGLLVELRSALQREGVIKPTTFGVPKPRTLASAGSKE